MFLKPEYRRVFVSKHSWPTKRGRVRFTCSTYTEKKEFLSQEEAEAWLEEKYDEEQDLPLIRNGNAGVYLLEGNPVEREGTTFFFLRALRNVPGPREVKNNLTKAVPKERAVPLTEAAVALLMGN